MLAIIIPSGLQDMPKTGQSFMNPSCDESSEDAEGPPDE